MDTDYYKYRYTCTACGFSCFGRDLKNEYRKEADLKIKLIKNVQPEPRQSFMPDEPRDLYQGEDRPMRALPREVNGSMV